MLFEALKAFPPFSQRWIKWRAIGAVALRKQTWGHVIFTRVQKALGCEGVSVGGSDAQMYVF